jgi:LmbE family N-acetylglucosaminyl deacetylase
MSTQEQTNPTSVLVIVAHPDDIEFGCAGSIARWVNEGAVVTYCMVTDGSAGSNDPAVQRDDLIRRRKEEQLAAAAHVGVKDVRFLGYQDSMLQPTLELRKELTRLIRELKPFRVVCQDPTTVFVRDGYINHPDHRAAGEAAIYAVFPSAETRPSFPELLAEGYEPHHVSELYLTLTLAPDTIVDISDTIEQKIASLRAHASQVGPESETWIREWNSELGKEHGYAYAEAFKVMKLTRD